VTIGGTLGTAGSSSLGLAAVQERIQAIRRQIGINDVSAWNTTTPTSATGGGAFADYLDRATSSAASTAGAASTATSSNSSSPASAAPAGYADAAQDASAILGPINTVKPAEMPGVPITEAMRAAGNGKLPDTLLSPISEGHRLAKPAAGGFVRMEAAARKDGVTIGITDSYRTYDEQVDVAARNGIYGQGGWAAVPGTSNHGWGMALDLDLDDSAQAWMRDNGWKYGFYEDVPNEPWHWTYRSSN
jgi:D-alanyl-D-alanine carboxypeptidase